MFRATPGPLPEADEIAGVALPPGRIALDDHAVARAWVSTEILPADRLGELVRALAAAFPQTGLWPVRVPKQYMGSDPDVPWRSGRIEPPVTAIPDALGIVLRNAAEDAAEFDEDDDDPSFPPPVEDLAPAQPGPDPQPGELDAPEEGALLLVPVARPADVPAALGWDGAVNADLDAGDVTALVRSWEDRFGAVLVSLGLDTMTLQVTRRPESGAQLDALAYEHYAFCSDNYSHEVFDSYRTGLSEWRHWNFWWD
ncbi:MULTISPECIES: DUF4253 domain-containing protein [Tsukamurella]|uniref:DUF4253 domain-containing protein n=2 Tax=Tsukamurella TaxID=2060 RepID=A0A5C5S844_9ACTN|nr:MULTISPECIES: DUF4253 domain-containing protein [Tsukamurella]NMD55433.1 DUF4253 domain-containing protein [Tsukamurella columbiensis]TWS30615.1 DUF4253 domain-containing protein [Tsukamurella conjunctivitidis]